jgi:hypothetical protein
VEQCPAGTGQQILGWVFLWALFGHLGYFSLSVQMLLANVQLLAASGSASYGTATWWDGVLQEQVRGMEARPETMGWRPAVFKLLPTVVQFRCCTLPVPAGAAPCIGHDHIHALCAMLSLQRCQQVHLEPQPARSACARLATEAPQALAAAGCVHQVRRQQSIGHQPRKFHS